jgi:hypothetical protein
MIVVTDVVVKGLCPTAPSPLPTGTDQQVNDCRHRCRRFNGLCPTVPSPLPTGTDQLLKDCRHRCRIKAFVQRHRHLCQQVPIEEQLDDCRHRCRRLKAFAGT